MSGLAEYPLLEALLGRRSRRFAPGLTLDGGPLTYVSEEPPLPLSLDEQAALAFAACGITGHALAELPFADGAAPETGGGNIMMHLVARTVASGDASHANTVFVIDDEGAWLLRRPQDHPPQEISGLIALAGERKLTALYERSRVRVADRRVDIPHDVSYMLSLNKWAANRSGTTYFLPIAELTAFYINLVLTLFGEEFSYFVLDDRNWFRPAGLGKFARSNGGTLIDDPKRARIMTVTMLETLLLEFAAVEQGGIMQNLGLMSQAPGLGGFPHFAAHPWIWERELGFDMVELPDTRVLGMNLLLRIGARLLGRVVQVPTPIGLQLDNELAIRPYCPPHYATMRDAVLAFVDSKYGRAGIFRAPSSTGAWRDPAAVRAGIPPYSDAAIEAAVAYCTYIYERYGRFPAASGPFRTTLAYQASRLDPAFYARFYEPGVLPR